MIPNKCPHCGAPVNRERAICEYCGTSFEDNAVRIVYGEAKADRISASVMLDDSMFFLKKTDLSELNEYAIRKLAEKLSEGLVPYMQIMQASCPEQCGVIYRGDIRVLRPGARF